MAKKKLSIKQRAMIEALVTTLGNVTASVKKVGISRQLHYEWLDKNPEYKKEYEAIDDMECDFYRTALHRLVKDGNPAAIIFGLKTKGKHRGYIERTETVNQNFDMSTITESQLKEQLEAIDVNSRQTLIEDKKEK